MTADPKRALAEVAAGRPGPSARRWLGPTVAVALVLFAIDTYFVLTNPYLPFDVPITIAVQNFAWGPVVYPMELINWLSGYRQVMFGLVVVIALLLLERRAAGLMAIGGISSLLDNLIKLAVSRQRPPADLVHILSPVTGYSYPSGHAVFFTWMSFMLAVALAPRTKPSLRPVLWTLAALVIVLTCLARVWAGAHWPSDVFGGVFLGIGWSAFVLWVPERWLPSPKLPWRRRIPRVSDA